MLPKFKSFYYDPFLHFIRFAATNFVKPLTWYMNVSAVAAFFLKVTDVIGRKELSVRSYCRWSAKS